MCVVVGCGGTVEDNPQVVDEVQTPAKAMLEEVAESGELGSAAMEIREALQTHPKSEEMLAELTKIEGLSRPADVKKKAKALADKL